MILPIFHTNYSLRSILNLSPSGKQKSEEAPSIFDCVKDLGLEKMVVIDDTPTAFMPLSEQAESEGVNLYYGLRFTVCNSIDDKTPESISSHAKYNILARDMGDKLHPALQKIYISSGTSGHYQETNAKSHRRIDLRVLEDNWDSDLVLMPCFYDGPAYQRLFHFSTHEVDTAKLSPLYEIQEQNLPFDKILGDIVKKSGETIHTHSVYYRRYNESLSFMAYKIAANRRFGRTQSIDAPNLDDFHSNTFCSEFLKGKNYEC